MDAHDLEQDPRSRRANVLYWESDSSVNDIADDLDLSKGTLYGLIRPLPADVECPECGAELEYANRTARDKAFVSCSSCGFEEEEELVRQAAAFTESPGGTSAPASRSAMLATAFLGAAAGIVLARWLRGR